MGCGGSKASNPESSTPAAEPEPEPTDPMAEIDMNGQGLAAFPEIGEGKAIDPTKCTKLELYGNQIKKVPPGIKELEKLELINCFNNKIGMTLPDELGTLCELTEVNFAANKLAMIKDPVFASWTKVSVLNLNDNNLSSVGTFAPMIALEEVRLYGNQLSAMPTLGSYPELKIFEVHKNRIEAPDDNYFDATPALERVSLWGNQLAKLPTSLTKCSNLVGVQAHQNPLTALPDGPWPATLETLFVQETQLTALPDALLKCALKRVNITGLSVDDALAKSMGDLVLKTEGGIWWGKDGKKMDAKPK